MSKYLSPDVTVDSPRHSSCIQSHAILTIDLWFRQPSFHFEYVAGSFILACSRTASIIMWNWPMHHSKQLSAIICQLSMLHSYSPKLWWWYSNAFPISCESSIRYPNYRASPCLFALWSTLHTSSPAPGTAGRFWCSLSLTSAIPSLDHQWFFIFLARCGGAHFVILIWFEAEGRDQHQRTWFGRWIWLRSTWG